MAATAPTRRRFDAVFASQATFRAVLAAMARPGTIVRLPVADPDAPEPRLGYAAAVFRTLIDREVSFAVGGPHALAEINLADHLAKTTAGRPVPVDAADYLLIDGLPRPGLLAAAKRGEPAYPERSATILAAVPTLWAGTGGEAAAEAGADGEAGVGAEAATAAAALAGPGVEPGTVLRVAGWTAADLDELAAINAGFPLGIDVLFVAPDGACAGLPRSTRLTPAAGGG